MTEAPRSENQREQATPPRHTSAGHAPFNKHLFSERWDRARQLEEGDLPTPLEHLLDSVVIFLVIAIGAYALHCTYAGSCFLSPVERLARSNPFAAPGEPPR